MISMETSIDGCEFTLFFISVSSVLHEIIYLVLLK
jgi:hypothetical protein